MLTVLEGSAGGMTNPERRDSRAAGWGSMIFWGLTMLDPSHPSQPKHTAGRASSGTQISLRFATLTQIDEQSGAPGGTRLGRSLALSNDRTA